MLSSKRLSTDLVSPHASSRRRPFPLWIAYALCFIQVGCSGATPANPRSLASSASTVSSTPSSATNETDQAQAPQSGATPNQFPMTFTDRLGRKVTIAKRPDRIISLSPSTTELLFALGAGSKIFGRTEYCNYPDAALQIPIVGKGTIEGISREAILAAHPDVVLFKWDSHQALIETFEPLGIPLIGIGPESVKELLAEAELLSRLTGTESNEREFRDRFESTLKQMQQAVAAIEPSKRAKVFYEVWDDPLMTAGPDSFIGELLTLANVENVFADVQSRYPRVSREVLVQRDPDVILAPTTHSQKVDIQKMAERPGWAGLRAVQNSRIHVIDGDLISRCGPRILSALDEIIRKVYPEVAPQLPASKQEDAPTHSGHTP